MENIFEEAINHCRWKKSLYLLLKKINICNYENKTFEEILLEIYNISSNIKGVGMLSVYDITAAICRYYKINIDKVYIIGTACIEKQCFSIYDYGLFTNKNIVFISKKGKGPKRAIKLLNIKLKKYRISNKINLNFVNIIDIINAFDNNNYELNEYFRNTNNGDILETYICNWQKTK